MPSAADPVINDCLMRDVMTSSLQLRASNLARVTTGGHARRHSISSEYHLSILSLTYLTLSDSGCRVEAIGKGSTVSSIAWNQRFFASTRGQVVALLRQGPATVEELAQALELTDNAIRAHLAALERDGLVTQHGLRRGVGKPAYTYALTAEAERLWPKAYSRVLQLMLGALGERMPAEEIEALMREVGRRLAAGQPAPEGDLRQRLEGAIAVLDAMGGYAFIEEQDGGFVIQGRSCPLAAAVEANPETCYLAEALLTEAIGVPVCQACDSEIPRCRFEIGVANGAAPREA
jgi:predicted ArsR family transcriptional regulator